MMCPEPDRSKTSRIQSFLNPKHIPLKCLSGAVISPPMAICVLVPEGRGQDGAQAPVQVASAVSQASSKPQFGMVFTSSKSAQGTDGQSELVEVFDEVRLLHLSIDSIVDVF